MKAYYLLVPLSVAVLGGCTVYRPAPVAYVQPAPVAYVSPPSTVIMGSGPVVDWNLGDSDGDGYLNGVDRQPYDSRFR